MAEYRARPQHELPPETKIKRCPECGIDKPLSEFSKNANRKDGHRSTCKVCQSAESKRRYAAWKVQADPNSTSSKSEKARKLGTKCISEAELYAMMK